MNKKSNSTNTNKYLTNSKMRLEIGTSEEKTDEYKTALEKTNKLSNQQLTSLLIDSIQTIEEQDEEIIQLTGERDAYIQGFEEAQQDINTLNTLLDKYEPRQIDDITITRINNIHNKSDRYSETRVQKIEQIKQKHLEIIKKKRERSNRLD